MKNLIAATYAPMCQDKSLNLEIVADYGAFLQSNGVAGAFVNGSTGDFVSLSTKERKCLIEAWALNKPDDFYLINHVGHTNLRESKEMAEHCADMVDAIGALPPFYFKPRSLDDLLHYCREVALSAPNTPFYYYHIPVLTGVDFSMEDFLDKASGSIENFAGIKYTNDELDDFQRCLKYDNGRFDIFFGIDEKFLDSLSYGASGWVGSTYNHLAPLYHEIVACVSKDNMEMAQELKGKTLYFVETLEQLGGFQGGSKGFMKYLGLDMGPSRFPHKTFEDATLKRAIELFDSIELSNYLAKPYHKNSVGQ